MPQRYPGSHVEVQGWEARHYDRLMDIATLGTYPFFIRKAVALMDITPSDRILDLGCGTGRNARLMAIRLSREGEVVGLDVGDEMITQFRRNLASYPNARIMKLRIEEPLPFVENFDKALISFVLHGFPHDVRMQVVDNVHRSLKPGGEFFVLDWNRFSLGEAILPVRLFLKHMECSYALDFITQDWPAILRERGFEECDQHPFYWKYLRLLRARKTTGRSK